MARDLVADLDGSAQPHTAMLRQPDYAAKLRFALALRRSPSPPRSEGRPQRRRRAFEARLAALAPHLGRAGGPCGAPPEALAMLCDAGIETTVVDADVSATEAA